MAQLALGTAQFGLDYGINNKRGRIPAMEVFKILRYALSHNIDTLDTASTYGESENVIGKYIKQEASPFKIISKYASGNGNVKKSVLSSLKKLNTSKIHGYLIHHFDDYRKDPGIWKEFIELRSAGLADKVGFSLYYPRELETLLGDRIKPDIVNIPYNILDQRFEEHFASLKKAGTEVHVRSVFLQGLLLKTPAELSGQFIKIKDKISALNKISLKAGLSAAAVCLCFAAVNKNIDKILIGVDSLENLKENVRSFGAKEKVRKILDELKNLKEYNEDIILPMNWSDKK